MCSHTLIHTEKTRMECFLNFTPGSATGQVRDSAVRVELDGLICYRYRSSKHNKRYGLDSQIAKGMNIDNQKGSRSRNIL